MRSAEPIESRVPLLQAAPRSASWATAQRAPATPIRDAIRQVLAVRRVFRLPGPPPDLSIGNGGARFP